MSNVTRNYGVYLEFPQPWQNGTPYCVLPTHVQIKSVSVYEVNKKIKNYIFKRIKRANLKSFR